MGDVEQLTFEAWASAVVLTMVFGVLGNGLTLVAITYATIRKKTKFDGINWYSTTIFIFNLAFTDIAYCLFMVCYMLYGLYRSGAYGLWSPQSVDHEESCETCKFFLLGIQFLAQTDGWSIAVIAMTRAIPYIK